MVAKVKAEEALWEKVQGSIDLLFSKLETQADSQQQVVAQMELTAKAVTQSLQEQLVLAQQLTTISVVVERLATEWRSMGESPRGEEQGGHQQGGLPSR
jgi:hypothetical protein